MSKRKPSEPIAAAEADLDPVGGAPEFEGGEAAVSAGETPSEEAGGNKGIKVNKPAAADDPADDPAGETAGETPAADGEAYDPPKDVPLCPKCFRRLYVVSTIPSIKQVWVACTNPECPHLKVHGRRYTDRFGRRASLVMDPVEGLEPSEFDARRPRSRGE